MSRIRRLAIIPVAAVLVAVGVCCQKPAGNVSPTTDGPKDRRADQAETTQPTVSTTTAPTGEAAHSTSSAQGTSPSEQPDQARLPTYIRVLESADASRGSDVIAGIPESGIINLTTSNVRKIRLLRESLPFAGGGSIAVRIDGQGIEWQQRYATLDLEQLANGSWEIVRTPIKP